MAVGTTIAQERPPFHKINRSSSAPRPPEKNEKHPILQGREGLHPLADNAHNTASTSPEAVYVNSLTVPAGTTLDLNGLHLYARATQIAGTILGGSVGMVADG